MRLPTAPTFRRPTSLGVVALIAASVVAGACAGGAPTGAPATATPLVPTPVIATPSPSPIGELGTYWLRATTSQAIPPVDRFAVGPTAVITGDGRYLVPGAMLAIYPGPLVAPYFARQLTDAGREQIVTWAEELGLLAGETDFTGGALVPGGVTGTIELTVDGRLVALTGAPDALEPDAEPGSPGAFAELWRRISVLPDVLGAELGPEQPWTPEGYALLVGPAPVPEEGLTGELADWPLETPLATLGGPVEDGRFRCAVITGGDAAVLAPALGAANQLTQWVQDPDTSATFGLTVRLIVGGEDPCAEAFGS